MKQFYVALMLVVSVIYLKSSSNPLTVVGDSNKRSSLDIVSCGDNEEVDSEGYETDPCYKGRSWKQSWPKTEKFCATYLTDKAVVLVPLPESEEPYDLERDKAAQREEEVREYRMLVRSKKRLAELKEAQRAMHAEDSVVKKKA